MTVPLFAERLTEVRLTESKLKESSTFSISSYLKSVEGKSAKIKSANFGISQFGRCKFAFKDLELGSQQSSTSIQVCTDPPSGSIFKRIYLFKTDFTSERISYF